MEKDTMLRGTLRGGQARVFVISSREMVETARNIHALTPVCTASLGRLMTAASVMGAQMKGENDTMTVILEGGGPAGKLIATADGRGYVKAMMENPHVDLPARETDHKLDVGGAVGKDGTITVVRDQGMKTPYTGRIPLVSGEIAEDLAQYFTVSEQTPSLVSLGVQVAPDGSVISAGGMFIQVMPGCEDDLIDELELRAPVLSDISRLMEEYTPYSLCEALFRGLEWEILEESHPIWCCDCSRDRIERALISLGKSELSQIIEEDRKAELTCHFCRKAYRFNEDELRALLAEASRA